MKMRTNNIGDKNYDTLINLFPNAITETISENGEIVRAIDADVLEKEINTHVVKGREERYQFTWPGKRQAMLAGNMPTSSTLRPFAGESIGRGGTQGRFDSENLYIEGDNLEVLKLLQETYLGKIQIIYIDPPYNTGGDFVYVDNYSKSKNEYSSVSGQYDMKGNRLVANLESNGRFHTDWLNMMYPRLRLAKNLLSDDGMIFISIGDEELENLKKISDEIFGASNFRNIIIVRRGAKSVQAQFDTWDKLGRDCEYILFYTKVSTYRFPQQLKRLEESRDGTWNNHWRGTDRPTMRYPLLGITPQSGQWRWSKERSDIAVSNYERMKQDLKCENPSQEMIDAWYQEQADNPDLLRLSSHGKPEHYIPPTNVTLLNSSWTDLLIGSSSEINTLFSNKVFDTAKLTNIIKRILGFTTSDATILDFFSGSATTAHAVMQLNAEDGGNRKFIMVQLPEETPEKSEARKAGYSNICEIGKERIRRAGAKIKEETGADIDYGFRVLKCADSNMKPVYYAPSNTKQEQLDVLADNIKEDRTEEDLLFQVMLELGVPLSSSIEYAEIAGQKVYDVGQNYLLACFDLNVTEASIIEIAKREPTYFVMRDRSMANDTVAANFEQIFRTYSPDTVRRVL